MGGDQAAPDRADRGRLFRGYIAFHERDESQAVYDRAWAAFMADDRLHALGARLEGTLVGITHFFLHPSTSGPDVCYLQDLFTTETARGHGAARALIAAVGDWARARGCARLYWLTQEGNATAQALYDKVAVNRGLFRYGVVLG
jgi:GNAT superfamily N-acetyltransferase